MSIDVLQEKIRVLKNPTMVGLDPTPEVVPGYLLEEARRERLTAGFAGSCWRACGM